MPISDIFNSITPGRPAITEAGCDAFAVIAADRQTLDEFMSQPRELVLHFLAALATTSQAGQALVAQTLATPDIVEKLAAEDDAQAVLSLLGKLDTRHQTTVLAAKDVVSALATKTQARAVSALIAGLDASQQAAVLSSPHAVIDLAMKGCGSMLLRLIARLPPEQQTAVLATPDALWALALKGDANAALSLVSQLDDEQKTTIMSSDDVVCRITRAQKAAILASPWAVQGLVEAGKSKAVLNILGTLEAQHRISILTAPGVMAALGTAGKAADVLQLVGVTIPPQVDRSPRPASNAAPTTTPPKPALG